MSPLWVLADLSHGCVRFTRFLGLETYYESHPGHPHSLFPLMPPAYGRGGGEWVVPFGMPGAQDVSNELGARSLYMVWYLMLVPG